MRKFLLIILGLAVFLLVFVPHVFAECDRNASDYTNCQQKQIDELQQKVNDLHSQSNTLSNQVAQFNAQISLAQLKITQTQDRIDLLSGRIDQLEGSLQDLTKAFSNRAVATYKMSRSNNAAFLILTSENVGEAISKFHYLQKVQESDRELMLRLQGAQNTYKEDKSQSEILEKQLKDQKANLDAQKKAKATLLAATQSDEKKYQQLLATAKAELAAFKSFVANHGGASILTNQTVCTDWGCYYNQRDSNWGLRPLGVSSLSVAEYGCLVSSSAMVASHYKKNLNPGDIAGTASAFFSPDSGTALLWKDITVNGVRILRTTIANNTGSIDSELSAGRPVIVGLYGGPAHFVVLKSGSGGNYTMNDPFVSGGHDISFTSKYKISDITEVESVSVQ